MRTDTTESTTQGTAVTDLSPTDIFGLLADDRRWYALRSLSRRVGSASVDELADELALREGARLSERRDRIRTSLHHHHLPRLCDAGVVRYDAERGTVELLDARDRLAPYLELADADELR
ncbi:DUF7344 domain-containing protein [Halorussus caseinilyticus]|uniref:DUF7344 domain-containing protein n=1 Tax=Halorussus caseinilyticus TaxID=3034025 RepID=A0ABD5WKN3_9EURY|nr:hypothetical protein [Halorussus sp. DT72]